MNKDGCIFLESGIDFESDSVHDCCINHNDGRGMPILLENYHGEPIDWKEIFKKKEERINRQKEKTIYDCEACYHLWPYEFKMEKKISEFHFSNCRLCNAKCIYCGKDWHAGDINYNVYPIIKDLIEKGYYRSGGEASFQGGEPTIMQGFDELVQLFVEKGTKFRVHTSGIKYSQSLADAMKLNKALVVISIDSGCRKTYNKIKQVDKFDVVSENIRKYSEANSNNVRIKYIVIPGVNDNISEIDKLFKFMKKYNVKSLALDMEVLYQRQNIKNISPHLFLIYDYVEKMCEKYKIEFCTYPFFLYALRTRKIKKSPLLNNKFLYVCYLNMCRNKKINLNYISD